MKKKRFSYFYGLYAELLAAVILMCKGYHILEWRYKAPVGEIDLLAKKKNALVIVEVKARKELDMALESLRPRAQHRIVRCADYYISRHPECTNMDIRFDIFAFGGLFSCKHLDNAWRPAA